MSIKLIGGILLYQVLWSKNAAFQNRAMINTQKIIPKDARILQTVYSRWFTPTIPAWSMMHAIMTWFFMISYDVEEWQVLHLRFSAVSVPENTQKCSRMWLHRDGVWQWGLRRHRKRPKDHLIIIRSVTRKQTVEQIITCRSRHNPAHLITGAK